MFFVPTVCYCACVWNVRNLNLTTFCAKYFDSKAKKCLKKFWEVTKFLKLKENVITRIKNLMCDFLHK